MLFTLARKNRESADNVFCIHLKLHSNIEKNYENEEKTGEIRNEK